MFYLLLKQTFLQTLPSSTIGYYIPFLAHVLLAFLFQQLSRNDTIPQGVDRHTTVNRDMLREFYFYWLHSGFYDDNKDRLQSEMKIARGLRLLKSTVQDFLTSLNSGSLSIRGETYT